MDPEVRQPRKAKAIFTATLSLLAERGYDALSVEAVARRAGVNKTTIYRTWKSKDDLLAHALRQAPELELQVPDTGSLRGDLIAVATQIADLLTADRTRLVAAALLSAGPDRPATAQAAEAFFTDRLQRERVIFDRAVERGELTSTSETDVIMELLAGALWFHVLFRSRSADRALITALVDITLAGASIVSAGNN